jgi:hypothetical protein
MGARLGVKLNVLAGDAGSRTVDSLDPAKTPVAPAMVGRADPDVIRSQVLSDDPQRAAAEGRRQQQACSPSATRS